MCKILNYFGFSNQTPHTVSSTVVSRSTALAAAPTAATAAPTAATAATAATAVTAAVAATTTTAATAASSCLFRLTRLPQPIAALLYSVPHSVFEWSEALNSSKDLLTVHWSRQSRHQSLVP